MHSRLSFLGVNCSFSYEVSNISGNYGQRNSILNIMYKPRKRGMINPKEISPIYFMVVQGPYKSVMSFIWRPMRESFYKSIHTLSPT